MVTAVILLLALVYAFVIPAAIREDRRDKETGFGSEPPR